MPINPHPLVIEYHALWKALRLGVKLGYSGCEVQPEGDAQLLINAINAKEESHTWFGDLAENVKQFLQSQHLWSIKFIYSKGT